MNEFLIMAMRTYRMLTNPNMAEIIARAHDIISTAIKEAEEHASQIREWESEGGSIR